jgi:hypothetical protein
LKNLSKNRKNLSPPFRDRERPGAFSENGQQLRKISGLETEAGPHLGESCALMTDVAHAPGGFSEPNTAAGTHLFEISIHPTASRSRAMACGDRKISLGQYRFVVRSDAVSEKPHRTSR